MMSDVELIQTATKLKEDGNAKFKAKLFKQAEGHYKDAIAHANTVKNDSEELKKLKIATLQNMSVCTNNTENYQDSVKNCTKAVELDDKAFKALYLRSVAQSKLQKWEEAMADIIAAIKLAPNDKNLRAHHAVCKEGKAKSTAKEKNAFAKFF